MFEYRCTILRVVDGDTVDVDIDLGFGVWLRKQRIRCFGIDTPESRTRDKEEKKFGLLAKYYVERFLPVGSKATLVTEKDGKGKFGRILGKFKVFDSIEDKQAFLHEIMTRDHIAVEYMGQSKELIAEQHIINRGLIRESGCYDEML